MARPTSLTPEVHVRIVDALRAGSYIHEAASYAGVHEATAHRWMQRGRAAAERDAAPEDDEWEFREFYESVMEARACARVEATQVVRRIMRTGSDELCLRAATWYLERSDPEHWGRAHRSPQASIEPAPEETLEQVRARAEDVLERLAIVRRQRALAAADAGEQA